MTGPAYNDPVYAIAECDDNGDLPSPLSAIHWIHTPYHHVTNTPSYGALHSYGGAIGTAARILNEAINTDMAHLGFVIPPTPLAIVHVTPDGCRPLVWIAYSPRCCLISRKKEQP